MSEPTAPADVAQRHGGSGEGARGGGGDADDAEGVHGGDEAPAVGDVNGSVEVDEVDVVVRAALPRDVRAIRDIVAPYAEERILIPKELVGYFEAIQEFVVAEVTRPDGGRQVVGCGALHVMWDDLAEVRTLAVHRDWRCHGIGHRILAVLLQRARELGLLRVFCLTFEVHFFQAHGFEVIDGTPVPQEVYTELLRSHDDGVAEFLDLAHVKPNTLGNTRMLVHLDRV